MKTTKTTEPEQYFTVRGAYVPFPEGRKTVQAKDLAAAIMEMEDLSPTSEVMVNLGIGADPWPQQKKLGIIRVRVNFVSGCGDVYYDIQLRKWWGWADLNSLTALTREQAKNAVRELLQIYSFTYQ